ncbi:MAG: restriction endonuclease subunit S [Saprospiraceae bacterium]
MGKWIEQSLGSLIVEEKKSTIQVQGASNYGGYLFFTSGDNVLVHDEFLVDGEKLFLATGGKANIKFYNGKAAYSTDTYVIGSEKASTLYLYYYLLNQIDFINSNLFTGSGLKHLQKNDFKKLRFTLPEDKPEQTHIAQILSTADKAIAQTEALIAKYHRIKTGLMQDLLTKGIDEHGNIRSEQTHRFKTEKGLRVPEEWEVKELDAVCKKISDGAHQGVVFDDQKDVPFLFVSCIKPNQILWENCAWIGFDNYLIVSKGKEPVRGMVLYSVVGSYGNAVTVEIDELFTFQRHIAFLIPDEKSLSSEFLTLFLNSEKGKRNADDLATGNAQKTITLTALRTFLIPLPKPDEQKRIFQKVKAASDLVRDNQKHLSKLQSLKTGLMQDLLSGKVRVKIKEETLVNP